MKYIIFLIFALSTHAEVYTKEALKSDKFTPLECSGKISKLFKTQDHDELEVDLITDLFHLHGTEIKEYRPFAPGVLVYTSNKGHKKPIAVQVSAVGNSRFKNCEWRPMRIDFDSKSLTKKLEKMPIGSDNDYSGLYKKITTEKKMVSEAKKIKRPETKRLLSGKSIKKGKFKNLSDNIKIVTHCGVSDWERIGSPDPKIQQKKLLQEFILYKMMSKITSLVFKTRLLKINYRMPDGSIRKNSFAFFLEAKKNLRKRCDLKKGKIEKNGDNMNSRFLVNFINKFLYTRDYNIDKEHNVLAYHNESGENIYISYDYDLAKSIHPDYHKNKYSLTSWFKYFRKWLFRHKNQEMTYFYISKVVKLKEEMRSTITKSKLELEDQKQMLIWFDQYFVVFEEYVNFQRYNIQKKKGTN